MKTVVNFHNSMMDIEINVSELFNDLPIETKRQIVEILSCDEEVIDFVMDQVFNGCTETGYSGWETCGANAEPAHGLDAARRRIALNSSDLAKEEIERLQKELKKEIQKNYELRQELQFGRST